MLKKKGEVWTPGELAATMEHMRSYVYMTHGMSFFCKFNVAFPQSSKRKRWLAALKLGFDKLDIMKYCGLGKVWGEPDNQFVIHDYMSLSCFNKKYGQFLFAIKDPRIDPYKKTPLETFEVYYLHQYMKSMENTLRKRILRELKTEAFSSHQLNSHTDETLLNQLFTMG